MNNDDARLYDAACVASLICKLAEIHYGHPDKAARLYGAFFDVAAEIGKELLKIRNEK